MTRLLRAVKVRGSGDIFLGILPHCGFLDQLLGLEDFGMSDAVSVVLGGREYSMVRPSFRGAPWFRSMMDFYAPLLRETLAARDSDGSVDQRKLIEGVFPYVFGDGLDRLIALLPVYCPALAGGIETATDEELLGAVEAMLEQSADVVGRYVKVIFSLMR